MMTSYVTAISSEIISMTYFNLKEVADNNFVDMLKINVKPYPRDHEIRKVHID